MRTTLKRIAASGFAAAALSMTLMSGTATAEPAPSPIPPKPQSQVLPSDENVALRTAYGCTTAPGPTGAGAHNCINVQGNGTRVDAAYSQYYYSTPIGTPVCERKHQFLYTKSDGTVVNTEVGAGDCINSVAMVATGDYLSLPAAPLYAKSGTSFCTRANNSATGGAWTPYACINSRG